LTLYFIGQGYEAYQFHQAHKRDLTRGRKAYQSYDDSKRAIEFLESVKKPKPSSCGGGSKKPPNKNKRIPPGMQDPNQVIETTENLHHVQKGHREGGHPDIVEGTHRTDTNERTLLNNLEGPNALERARQDFE
jgi:hypothetical protein